jgi:HPt (histidine-containing phosphotransfer) domain-containing protein
MTVGTTGDTIRARLADLIDDGGPADVALVERLALSFMERQAGLLARLADAVAGADAEAVARHAHALKGSAGNVGATAVATLCAEAEHLAGAHSWDELIRYPDRLRTALTEATEELARAAAELRNA